MNVRRFGAAALGAVLVALALPAAPAGAADDLPDARRVLVLVAPGLTWEELVALDVPHLDGIVRDSAIANLAVRVERLATEPGEGYATFGAGTRALAPDDEAGLARNPNESFEGAAARFAYERIIGVEAGAGPLHLRYAELDRLNDRSLYAAELGTLGTALGDAGVVTGVVGNADHRLEPIEEDEHHREIALTLANNYGQVACGSVGSDLLVRDPQAPFGLRLDDERVLAEATSCWSTDRAVVAVELSDLRRADDYREFVTSDRREQLRRTALERSDALVGRLLEQVDPARDAVVLVAPSAPLGDDPRLTTLAVRAPGLGPGLLESAVTRQPGFVTIVDLAPTIAALAGVELPDEGIEGRAAVVGDTGDRTADRLTDLIDDEHDAQFRDRILTPFIITLIALLFVMSLLFAYSVWRGHGPWRLIEVWSLALLFVFPLTYWTALFPFSDWGGGWYATSVLGGAAVLGVLADTTRRRPLAPIGIACLAILGTVTASVVLLGSRLQLSTVFGDSPIVAGRFSGVNNVTFSQVVVATVLLAAFVRHRFPDRSGAIGAGAVLGATLLVIGAPMWGADIGGVLAGLPAFAVTFALLVGWRVRLRTIVAFGAAAVGLLLALGLLDLTRASEDRSHLGRFLERIGEDGWDGFQTVIGRKAAANLRTVISSVWRFITIPLFVFAGFLAWRAPGRAHEVRERVPELDAALAGLGVAAALGYAVNDSGIAVPAVMVAVLIPAAAYLVARHAAEPDVLPDRHGARA
ncbi:MAG TPA: hypothetical protein VFZ83_14055, partial [Acidimicrobiia bacterium]|nr:hypothetical protein [Acidimicrobiia bacterium]